MCIGCTNNKQPTTKEFNILHLEASEKDQKIFKQSLQQLNLNYIYKPVSSIPETKKLINSNKFDILILDYFPFFADSYDLYSEIKNIPTIKTHQNRLRLGR